MAIRIHYRISYADYVECQRYRRALRMDRWMFWRRWKMARVGFFVLLGICGLAFIGAMTVYVHREFLAGHYGAAALSASLLAAIFLSYYFPRFERKKQIAAWPPIIMEIDEEKILMGEESAQKRRLWGYFLAFAETKNLFLLTMDHDRMLLIPKRSFENPQACAAFAELARARIGCGEKAVDDEVSDVNVEGMK